MISEDRLIVLLARGQLSAGVEKRAHALLEQPLDWDCVLQKVVDEEVYPLFYRNVCELEGKEPRLNREEQRAGSKEQGAQSSEPEVGDQRSEASGHRSPVAGLPSVLKQLGGVAKINAFRNTLLTEELVRVLKLFSDAAIPAIPLKGPALAQSLYGDASLRSCVDLDILVPRSMVGRAFELLRAQGYASDFGTDFFANVLLRHDIEYSLRRQERGFAFMVELHWGVFWGGKAEESVMARLWADATPATVFGAPAYALSSEWQVLVLAAHAARHQWQGLKWLVDLHALYSAPDIDWDKLTKRAAQLGWQELLRISLCACHRLFDTPVPANFSIGELPYWMKLFPDSALASLSDAFFATRVLHRPIDKLRYVARVFLVPTLAEQQFIALPPFLSFLYYPLRPLRLLCKWSGAAMVPLWAGEQRAKG